VGDNAVVPVWSCVVETFAGRLAALGWAGELWVGGSAACGDYRPGVSDLDLVALVDGPIDVVRGAALTRLHRDLDAGPAAGVDLGCAYVEALTVLNLEARHPTWTHGRWAGRILSEISRVELARHGVVVFGRSPREVLPAVDDDAVRRAARAELTGYWAWAAHRPWLWLDRGIAELGLTAMARGRYALATGRLLRKTDAVERAAAPSWLVERLRARRRGAPLRLPRLRTAMIAWRDARRTVAIAHRARDSALDRSRLLPPAPSQCAKPSAAQVQTTSDTGAVDFER
jgi:hypothetical protein